MMNAKISQKHDNVHCIRNNFVLKFVYNDRNECVNDMLLASGCHLLLIQYENHLELNLHCSIPKN